MGTNQLCLHIFSEIWIQTQKNFKKSISVTYHIIIQQTQLSLHR